MCNCIPDCRNAELVPDSQIRQAAHARSFQRRPSDSQEGLFSNSPDKPGNIPDCGCLTDSIDRQSTSTHNLDNNYVCYGRPRHPEIRVSHDTRDPSEWAHLVTDLRDYVPAFSRNKWDTPSVITPAGGVTTTCSRAASTGLVPGCVLSQLPPSGMEGYDDLTDVLQLSVMDQDLRELESLDEEERGRDPYLLRTDQS